MAERTCERKGRLLNACEPGCAREHLPRGL